MYATVVRAIFGIWFQFDDLLPFVGNETCAVWCCVASSLCPLCRKSFRWETQIHFQKSLPGYLGMKLNSINLTFVFLIFHFINAFWPKSNQPKTHRAADLIKWNIIWKLIFKDSVQSINRIWYSQMASRTLEMMIMMTSSFDYSNKNEIKG